MLKNLIEFFRTVLKSQSPVGGNLFLGTKEDDVFYIDGPFTGQEATDFIRNPQDFDQRSIEITDVKGQSQGKSREGYVQLELLLQVVENAVSSLLKDLKVDREHLVQSIDRSSLLSVIGVGLDQKDTDSRSKVQYFVILKTKPDAVLKSDENVSVAEEFSFLYELETRLKQALNK